MLGDIIGGALKFFGAEKDRESQERIAQQNLAEQQRVSNLNYDLATRAQETANQQWRESFDVSKAQFERNIAKQEEFAKMGVQWKVADAIAAGLHPLYALGGGASYSPAAVVGASTSGAPTPRLEAALRQGSSSSAGGNLARMGQDISRAVMASESVEQREQTRAMSALSLERAGLENDLLRSQIARTNASPSPGIPDSNSPLAVPGQSQSGGKGKKAGAVQVVPGFEHQESGAVPDIGYSLTSTGRYAIVPSNEMKQRIEDSPFEWSHFYRQIKNHIKEDDIKGPYPAPAGHHWQFYPDEMTVGLVKNWRNLLPENRWFNIRTNN